MHNLIRREFLNCFIALFDPELIHIRLLATTPSDSLIGYAQSGSLSITERILVTGNVSAVVGFSSVKKESGLPIYNSTLFGPLMIGDLADIALEIPNYGDSNLGSWKPKGYPFKCYRP